MLIPLEQKVVVSIVYVIAMFMAAMDATIVNVALVTISKEFQVPSSAIGTINIGYLVSLATFLPVSGWMGDRFGSKRIFLLAFGVFTVASALCGTADSLMTLNLFRLLQGAGAGLLTPIGMALLLRAFQPSERLKITKKLIIPIALAPAMGPILGGFLVDFASWRWIFYVNLPVGMMCLLFGCAFLKEHKEAGHKRFDLLGFLLSVIGFPMVMYALIQVPARGWSSPEIMGLVLGGALLLSIFVYRELHVDQPMMNVRLFSDRLFRTMGLISLFIAAGLQGMIYVFPLMYQDAIQASALDAGLTTFPEALGLMISSQFVPWFYSRLGPRRMIIIALLCSVVLFGFISFVQKDTDPWLIRALLFGSGFFLGNAVGAVQTSAFYTISPSSMGQASTLFHVQNRLGSALGVALLTSILTSVGTAYLALLAYRSALLCSAGFLLAALLFALTIRDDEVAVACTPAPFNKTKVPSVNKES